MPLFEPPDLRMKTVLVVEDNDDHLELLTTFLQVCRARTLGARNVAAATTWLTTTRVDLLISDLAMPGEDGLSLIRSIRRSTRSERTLRAIAITGFPEAYSTARMHGFDVLLEKPIDVVVLAAKIRELFGL